MAKKAPKKSALSLEEWHNLNREYLDSGFALAMEMDNDSEAEELDEEEWLDGQYRDYLIEHSITTNPHYREAPTAEHPVCAKCALFNTAQQPFWESFYEDRDGEVQTGLPDYSVDGGWIFLLGDGVGKEMDEEQKCMDLAVLFNLFKKQGYAGRLIYSPGTLCVTPPDPRGKPRLLKKPEIKKCYTAHIDWKIKDIAKLGLKAVIAAGPVAAYSIFGTMDIKGLIGQRKRLPWDRSVMAFATIDVESTLVAVSKKPILAAQVEWIAAAMEGTLAVTQKHVIEYEVAWCAEDVRAWFAGITSWKAPLLWDVESTGVKPFATGYKVGLFSFHHKQKKKPLIVATPDYGPAYAEFAKWQAETGRTETFDELYRQTKLVLKEILEDEGIPKLGHNQQFDELSIFATERWNLGGYYADTMIWNYLLSPDEKRNGLEALVQKWYPEANGYWEALDAYKEEFNIQSYLDIAWDVLVPYAAYDTWVLWPIFIKILENYGTLDEKEYGGLFVTGDANEPYKDTYSLFEYALHGRKVHQRMCTHLSKQGATIDLDLLPKVEDVYQRERTKLGKELDEHPDVLRFCEEKLGPNAPKNTVAYKAWKKGLPPRINWGSPPQLKKFFIEFIGLTTDRRTGTGGVSLDETALMGMIGAYPLIKTLLDWRGTDKFITSFLKPLVEKRVLWDDGKTHSDFRPSGTETSRLASSAPNVQAIPRDGLVKKLYCSRKRAEGGWIVTRDYSGLEVRVLACIAEEPILIEIFLNGGDPHFTTQKYFFKEKADKKNKTQRSICKQCLFGRIYGQTDMGLLELLIANGVTHPETGEPLTIEDAAAFNRLIDETYRSIPTWVQSSHHFSAVTKWTASPFGFVRPLDALKDYEYFASKKYDKESWKDQRFRRLNSAINKDLRRSQNTSIQSAAGDLTVFAGYEIETRLRKAGLDSTVVNIVHDDIWIDCPETQQVAPTVTIMKDVMDYSPEWLGDLLPGYDASWIKVPIIGECDVGINPKDALGVYIEPCSKTPDLKLALKAPPELVARGLGIELVLDDKGQPPADFPAALDFSDHSRMLRQYLDLQRLKF